jgi:hypothetical protein
MAFALRLIEACNFCNKIVNCLANGNCHDCALFDSKICNICCATHKTYVKKGGVFKVMGVMSSSKDM